MHFYAIILYSHLHVRSRNGYKTSHVATLSLSLELAKKREVIVAPCLQSRGKLRHTESPCSRENDVKKKKGKSRSIFSPLPPPFPHGEKKKKKKRSSDHSSNVFWPRFPEVDQSDSLLIAIVIVGMKKKMPLVSSSSS